MQGLYYRVNKHWIVKFTLLVKIKGEKAEARVCEREVPNQLKAKGFLVPPLTGEQEVQFDVVKTDQVNWSTLKPVVRIQPIITASSSQITGGSSQILIGLPRSFSELNSIFRELPPKLQDSVLAAIGFREGVKLADVKLLLTAVQQDYPLAFTSSLGFRRSLKQLIQIESTPEDTPGRLQIFRKLGAVKRLESVQLVNLHRIQYEPVPLTIMIHGSSVAGLRAKDKGRGWQFSAESDIDVTIIDLTRFVWAQIIGILTYDNADTIELTDTHLHLLKLSGFAEAFRKTVKGRQVNFMIYADVETARRHEGFTLECTFNPLVGDFDIVRIYNPELNSKGISQKDLTGVPRRLRELFAIEQSPQIEKWVTLSDLEELRIKGQRKIPEQGNHVFNDVPAELIKTELFLIKEFDSPPTAFVLNGYIKLLKCCTGALNLISREKETARQEHGKFADAITGGFEILSDDTNELLFGNALIYFRNTSSLFCKIGTSWKCSPKRLANLAPLLKKTFANLLDSAVDIALVLNLEKFGKSYQRSAYALQIAHAYRHSLRNDVNRFFKRTLDGLILAFAEELVRTRLLNVDISTASVDDLHLLFRGLSAEQAWEVSKLLGLNQLRF